MLPLSLSVYRQLYNLTQCDSLNDEGLVTIELLSPNDQRFGFLNGLTWLSYTTPLGKNEKGTILRILLTSFIKSIHQYDNDFVLNFTPMTQLGWLNTKALIMNNCQGMSQLRLHPN